MSKIIDEILKGSQKEKTKEKEEKLPSLGEFLEKALSRGPKSYDSKGNEYYLGPTVGMLVTVWCEKNAGIYNKILNDMIRGKSDKFLINKYKVLTSDLTMHHLLWMRKRLVIEQNRKKLQTSKRKEKISKA